MSNINKAAVLNPLPAIVDNIVDYIPRATTSKFGIVALGSGINVDSFGRIYLDTQEYSDRLTTIEAQAASALATQKSEVATAIAQVNLAQSQTITALTLEVNNLKTSLTDSITATQTDLINRADQLAQNVADITDQLVLDKAAFTQEIQDALVYLENAESVASALRTARTFTWTGDATGSLTFNGTSNVTTPLVLANSGVSAGTYKSVTVDAKGRVTAGSEVTPGMVTATTNTGAANVATTNTNTFLNITEKVGSNAATVKTSTQITGTGSVTVSSDATGKLTITGSQSIAGNAATATKFATARTINGVSFDGSADITLPLASTSVSGTVQLNNTLTSTATTHALTAAQGKVLNDNKLAKTENAVSASKLQTSRTISLTGGITGSVSFDGSANATIATTVTGLGAANGIATLDSSGQVPSTQLPSYVDDVLEYPNVAAFPTTGETGKIYVETTGNTTYRWSGSGYIKITSGEVSSVAGKTGVVTLTKEDVGLSSVNNTSDINKPISAATQAALNGKLNNGQAFFDAYAGAPDYYIDANTGWHGFTSISEFPLGSRILVAQNATYTDYPKKFSGDYAYIETKQTFGNAGRLQIAYDYASGELATRSALTGSSVYSKWLYSFSHIQTSGQNFDLNNATNGVHSEYIWQNAPNNTIGTAVTYKYSNDWIHQLFFDTTEGRIHARNRHSGTTWSNWNALAYTSDNVASASQLQTAWSINGVPFNGTQSINIPDNWQSIGYGADLNNYTTAGYYYCDVDIDAASMLNTPLPYAFSLIVEKTAGVIQRLTGYLGAQVFEYKRAYYLGSWGTWDKVVSANHKADALKNVVTKHAQDETFILEHTAKGGSGFFFDSGAGKTIERYSSGFFASHKEGGFFTLGAEPLNGRIKAITGVVRADNSIDFKKTHTVLTKESTGLGGNLVTGFSTSNIASLSPIQVADFLAGKSNDGGYCHYLAVNGPTSGGSFPDSYGAIEGFSSKDNYCSYSWQRFSAVNGGQQYIRFALDNDIWSAWTKTLQTGDAGLGSTTTRQVDSAWRTENGFFTFLTKNQTYDVSGVPEFQMGINSNWADTSNAFQILAGLYGTNQLGFRTWNANLNMWGTYKKIYHVHNTTVDSNGFIKAASPIVQLYADRIELNEDAKKQTIEFEKLGTGDYLIKNSTGLALEGWYVEQPKDANGNIYHAVEYGTHDNGDIWVKTYEQMMDGTRIVADHNTPIDIKENRFISVRLNELPEDTSAPTNPTIVDNEGNAAPSRLHELVEGVWVISDENAAILEQERLAAMKPLKRRQFRLTLAMNGYDLNEIETLINQIEDPMQRTIAQIEWQDATDFERTNPTLLMMAQMLGLTSEQVDSLWEYGLTL